MRRCRSIKQSVQQKHAQICVSLIESENCPFGVNTTIELKNITATSDNTGKFLNQNIALKMLLLSDVVVMCLSPIVVIKANSSFRFVSLLHSLSGVNCQIFLSDFNKI